MRRLVFVILVVLIGVNVSAGYMTGKTETFTELILGKIGAVTIPCAQQQIDNSETTFYCAMFKDDFTEFRNSWNIYVVKAAAQAGVGIKPATISSDWKRGSTGYIRGYLVDGRAYSVGFTLEKFGSYHFIVAQASL